MVGRRDGRMDGMGAKFYMNDGRMDGTDAKYHMNGLEGQRWRRLGEDTGLV